MSNDKKNYLEPKDFFDEIIRCLIAEQMSDKLGEMFFKVATKYANHRNFIRYYHLRDDLVSAGLLACCKSFTKFKPLKMSEGEWDGEMFTYHHSVCNNPFAFFTTCIHNDWLQLLKKDYKSKNIVNAIRVKNGLEPDFGYNDMIKDKERNEASASETEFNTYEEHPPVEDLLHGIEWND